MADAEAINKLKQDEQNLKNTAQTLSEAAKLLRQAWESFPPLTGTTNFFILNFLIKNVRILF